MNYYDARELTKDGVPTGLFRYICRNDGRVWPVGYCAEDCPGHDTPDEAREHFRQYLLDNVRLEDHFTPNQQAKCAICGAWTQKYADIPQAAFLKPLCDAHRNREGVASILPLPGQVMSSW